ncbi:MAG: hypothetical protein JST59_30760, partial [Actinobacteria bacterium]|nr:hypothetical protein [Actinomycetota bacterium]
LLVALVAEPSPLLLALTFVIVGAGQGAVIPAMTGTVFFGHLGSATSAAAYGEAFAFALGTVLAILAIAGALGRRVYVQVNPGG